MDPIGNSSSVHADFAPPRESLAFVPTCEGEVDLTEIWPDPLPCIIKVLAESIERLEALRSLPDIEVISGHRR
jgi:hypothetical protein